MPAPTTAEILDLLLNHLEQWQPYLLSVEKEGFGLGNSGWGIGKGTVESPHQEKLQAVIEAFTVMVENPEQPIAALTNDQISRDVIGNFFHIEGPSLTRISTHRNADYVWGFDHKYVDHFDGGTSTMIACQRAFNLIAPAIQDWIKENKTAFADEYDFREAARLLHTQYRHFRFPPADPSPQEQQAITQTIALITPHMEVLEKVSKEGIYRLSLEYRKIIPQWQAALEAIFDSIKILAPAFPEIQGVDKKEFHINVPDMEKKLVTLLTVHPEFAPASAVPDSARSDHNTQAVVKKLPTNNRLPRIKL
ncbi:MAG: hypothetical protein ACOYK8_08690 [Alphaproteobacteria bacterium]